MIAPVKSVVPARLFENYVGLELRNDAGCGSSPDSFHFPPLSSEMRRLRGKERNRRACKLRNEQACGTEYAVDSADISADHVQLASDDYNIHTRSSSKKETEKRIYFVSSRCWCQRQKQKQSARAIPEPSLISVLSALEES